MEFSVQNDLVVDAVRAKSFLENRLREMEIQFARVRERFYSSVQLRDDSTSWLETVEKHEKTLENIKRNIPKFLRDYSDYESPPVLYYNSVFEALDQKWIRPLRDGEYVLGSLDEDEYEGLTQICSRLYELQSYVQGIGSPPGFDSTGTNPDSAEEHPASENLKPSNRSMLPQFMTEAEIPRQIQEQNNRLEPMPQQEQWSRKLLELTALEARLQEQQRHQNHRETELERQFQEAYRDQKIMVRRQLELEFRIQAIHDQETSLQNNEQRLNLREQELKALQSAQDLQTQTLNTRQQELESRGSSIERRESELKHQEQELTLLKNSLALEKLHLEETASLLKLKEEQLDQKEQHFHQISRIQQELEDKVQQCMKLESTLQHFVDSTLNQLNVCKDVSRQTRLQEQQTSTNEWMAEQKELIASQKSILDSLEKERTQLLQEKEWTKSLL
ncbi:MAG: hypothetical protein HQM12_09025, partial [SAR324 cluster bacterium]|nr:hypothetical protein [SAR324 cluster bacterium]